jgi:beta-galactosidase GanA
MYMNAALPSAFGRQHATTYGSGGPVHHVIDVYKAAAPAIDFVAPDIYTRDHASYLAYLGYYDRPDNALMVPETGNDKEFARYFFPTVGQGAIGFAPFGMDYTGYQNYPLGAKELDDATLEMFARNYRLFEPMQREWARWAFEGKTWGVAEPTDPEAEHSQHIDMGKYNMTVTFGQWQFGSDKPTGNPEPSGGVAVAQLGENEFLVTGFNARVYFGLSRPAPLESMMLLRVEEGYFDKGKWIFRRVWNGDSVDYGLNFTNREQVLRVKLTTVKGTPPIPVGNPN